MKEFKFQKAVPVWEKGKEREKNYTILFSANGCRSRSVLYIAASTVYQVIADGKFIAAGPARAAHGYFKVDCITLPPCEEVMIYVNGYNTDTFSTVNAASFLCAEIVSGDEIISATGAFGFKASVYDERIQRVQRYSYQRGYSEYYVMNSSKDRHNCELSTVSAGIFLERGVYYPEYDRVKLDKRIQCGNITFEKNVRPYEDRAITEILTERDGFVRATLDFEATEYVGNIKFDITKNEETDVACFCLDDKEFMTFGMAFDNTGFINLSVECNSDTRLIMTFDEKLELDDINYVRNSTCNVIVYDLSMGKYSLTTMEPYTFKYIRIIAIGGKVKVSDFNLIEYKFPKIDAVCPSDDERDIKIFNAALESFRQCTLDIYMDCPSRERAGWLCDSYFMGNVEKLLTGDNVVEKSFLENFLLFDRIKNLPDKMLPMLYPADFRTELFIPNWAMWYVLQLEEYFQRSNDRELIDKAENRLYALIEYFKGYENEYGLLEKLDNWVFIEWSDANKYTQDVNFPTNMLYYRMKIAMSVLYNDAKLRGEAERLRSKIIAMSYVDGFFHDRALRNGDKLETTQERTETAQYYAFFMGVADVKAYSELWGLLMKDFGPLRADDCYPEISRSNAFIGNYLRLELIRRYASKEQLIDETRSYFGYMADETGTLWEDTDPSNSSLCHGFASYALLCYCNI